MSIKSIYSVIRRPLVTEKSMGLKDLYNQVTFEVRKDASKTEIRQAVEELFEARVESVNTMIVRGKRRRVGRSFGRRPNWKKAVVTLAEGEQIEALELLATLPEEDAAEEA